LGWVATTQKRDMTDERLTFISPAIIERIENGAFVPARRSYSNLQMSDRRDVLSPLAVTKRCIRYEPNVFHHRQSLIIQMANALNLPEKKIMLVGGVQGCGKTSLVRGLIELMGSRNEQLLWFDVNRHTDFDEIIQFLIQYITYICSAVGESGGSPAEVSSQEAPIKKLEGLINRVSQMPLLIVLDNVEYIVDAELRFNSYPFKEMLNFLLAFPNIKMVLIGERLPYADMSPNQEGVENIRLEGLSEPEATQFLQSKRKQVSDNGDPAILELAAAPEAERAAIRQLYRKTHGYPWLLKVLFYLNHQANLDFYTLNRLLNSEQVDPKELPIGDFVRYIYQRLPDQHRRVFQVLCFIRHSIDAKSLLALMGVCYPVLGPSGLDRDALEDILEHSLLKSVLKISYPPQDVLAHIRNRKQRSSAETGKEKKYRPWYELYHAVKKILYASMPAEERDRIHGVLQDFYMREKGQDVENRILRIKSRAILAEAKYHGSVSRERKPSVSALPVGVELVDDSTLASKVYLSQHTRPVVNPQQMTLDDYRSIQIPGPSEVAPAMELTPDSPTFLELLEGTSGKLTLQEQLAELELTDEEKELLYEKNTGDAPFLPVSNPTSVAPKPAEQQTETPRPEAVLSARSPEEVARDEFEVLTQSDSNEDEQEKAIQRRLTAAVASQDKPVVVRELVELARYRAGHGRFKSAEECLEKALSMKSDAKREVLAEIYRLSGSVNKATYHHNAALMSLSKAAVEIRRLMYEDDTVDASWMGRLGQVYQDLGEIYAYRKNYDEAVEALNQALRWYHSADDEPRQAEVHFQLAGVYDDQSQAEAAIEHYIRALTLDEVYGNKLSAASSLANLGSLHRERGEWAEALECFHRSLIYDREIQNIEGQLNTLDALAAMLLDRKSSAKAEVIIQQGLTLALQEGSSLWQASFYMRLGQLHEMKQEWPQALKAFQLAYSSGVQELSSQSLGWIRQKLEAVRSFVPGS
jgi:tetratricopeptide (TPR) repeat protein